MDSTIVCLKKVLCLSSESVKCFTVAKKVDFAHFWAIVSRKVKQVGSKGLLHSIDLFEVYQ